LSETKQYVEFLRNQKGLSDETIRRHAYWAEKLLRSTVYLAKRDFDIASIELFIERECAPAKRSYKGTIIDAVRSFLTFMHWSGKTAHNLSRHIIRTVSYDLQSIPGVLPWPAVQRMIGGIDKTTALGMRDYAIAVLLCTYGLRSGEITRLTLENIDWRNDTIHITHRKSLKDLLLPLTATVGAEILSYLKNGRPKTKYREVFLHDKSPLTPLSTSGIASMIRRRFRSAGIELPPDIRKGAHLFRHSFATHLVRQGASLKQIGDILGHRDPKSTRVYTKTAVDQLKDAALEVPGVIA
jgi:site-specific recombinase XerD